MSSSTSKEYRLLREDEEIYKHNQSTQTFLRSSNFTVRTWLAVVALTVVLSNFSTAIFAYRLSQRPSPTSDTRNSPVYRVQSVSPIEEYPIVDELPTVYTEFKWWTPWGLPSGGINETNPVTARIADELWDAVLPSHGMIAVDRTWAKERNWPESMYLPLDEHGKEKGVYLLEGYHLIHCLTIVRRSFIEARQGLPLTWEDAHTSHCFDALRQSIQCNADNTPLYTFGDQTAGDGQVRKCKSWDALREFATANTACYHDTVSLVPLRQHFNSCEPGVLYQNGRDGLP